MSASPETADALSCETLDELLGRVIDSQPLHASWHDSGILLRNRRSHRIAFRERFMIVGLERDRADGSFRAVDDMTEVTGRDISVDGISFRHHAPLPHRYVAVDLKPAGVSDILVARLTWCRYSKYGDYISGGRLLRSAVVSTR